jgi:iron(III) transport system ATP-binding protein
MTALRFDRILHRYGRHPVLREFSLGVEDGTIMSLLGPSGSGKTTALRIAAGLEIPQAGEVHLAGREVNAAGVFVPPEARDVGLLFQDLALFPHLDVSANIAFGLKQAQAARRARVDELLDLVGLEGMGRLYPHQLSGGQQQRVALARALAPGPRILLLDEPFSSLDVVLRQQVRQETISLLKRIGTSVLFVTHDPEEALYVADRVAVMREGLILQEAAPDDIYLKPASRFVAEFFGDTTIIPVQVRAGRADTPFGAMHAHGVPDGKADFVIRAAGLSLASAGNVEAIVRSARLLGPSLMVEVEPVNAGGLPRTLTARLPLGAKPAIGTRVYLALDPQLAFVFSAEA